MCWVTNWWILPGVSFQLGRSVTNLATLSCCKRKTCEKKKKYNFTGLYLKPNDLEMGSSLEWADSLNVDFLLKQNALKNLI